MRIPLAWLAEYVDVPADATCEQVAADLVRVGLEEESWVGSTISGRLLVGRVETFTSEPQSNGKTIRWCQLDVANPDGNLQGVVCGASNFHEGDLVVVAMPGCVLPGGFTIGERKTYGHLSAGMICSATELGLSGDNGGIIRLAELGLDAKPGDDAAALLGLSGLEASVVEVNVTPDRGYCFSIRGIAREYAHGTRRPVADVYRDPAQELTKTAPAPSPNAFPVHLKDTAPLRGAPGCLRFVTRVVRGVDGSATSPAWLQRRLDQAGMRPISLVVDIANYVMLALGQPLHTYDLARVDGSITVRRAKPDETLVTLDGTTRKLHPEDLLICDGENGDRAVGIAGVMGGQSTEVTSETRDVLIESAWFDPVTIARAARRHRLHSEASKRFERGVDTHLQEAAAELAVRLLTEHGGGTVGDEVGCVGQTPTEKTITIPVDLPARRTGVNYAEGRVAELLTEVGCVVTEDGDNLNVQIPTWRPDLNAGADLVEEVVRLDGYDAVPSLLPTTSSSPGLTFAQRVRRVVRDHLAANGLVEVSPLPFESSERHGHLRIPAGDPRLNAIRVANPLSEEEPFLRTSLLSTLATTLRRNISRGASDIGLYEVGAISTDSTESKAGGGVRASEIAVTDRPTQTQLAALATGLPQQRMQVAAILTGNRELAGWWGPGRAVEAGDAIAIAESIATKLGVQVSRKAATTAPWHPGRCATLELSDGTIIGHAGELHPGVLTSLELPERTVGFELDLDALIEAAGETVVAAPIRTFPVAKEDVALIVDESVPTQDVAKALREGGGDLVESVRLFDVYTGEQVPEGKKSLAFALRLRANDHTLSAIQVASTKHAALKEAQKRCGAEQRV